MSSNEQKVTGNEQKVTRNKQKVTSNEQKVTSNEQRAKSFTSYFFNSPIKVYSATNVRKSVVPIKFWQIFKLSLPIIIWGGVGCQKPCIIKLLLSYLLRKHTIHALDLSFVNQKNEKIWNWSLLMKIISTFHKLFIFQNNWSVYCIPVLWICRQLKYHQLRISEIFISLEIILGGPIIQHKHGVQLFDTVTPYISNILGISISVSKQSFPN